MKLAILSGTFNPVHNVHIETAEYVKDIFDYDKILLIPAYNPPFKEFTLAPGFRMDMVKLAVKDCDWLEVSDVEYRLGGKSYSVLTLEALYREYDIEGRIGFILGTDAYRNLDKWYEADRLKKLADFIVFERGFSFEDNDVQSRQQEGFNLLKAEKPFKNVSSTEIRNRIAKGLDISEFVNKDVERYIKKNGLYK